MLGTIYFLPHLLVEKTLSLYIANKIAKDQYVCTKDQYVIMYVQQPNVLTTTILTMTPDHMCIQKILSVYSLFILKHKI